MKKKTIIAMVAIALVLVCAIGGTVAWLVDSTTAVKNTFTFGDIDITLTETTGTEYKVYPGAEVKKDPTVTVEGGSEACWLFVEVKAEGNAEALTYVIADGWEKLVGVDGVYYREVGALATDQDFAVLKDNMVTVSNTLTKEDFAEDGLSAALTFTAYAVQKEGFETAKSAWDVK